MPDFKVDSRPLADMLQEQERAVLEAVPRAVDDAADAVLAHMKRRTGRGVDTASRRFQSYSERYARRAKGGRRQPVTLIRRGDMLNDLRVVKTASGRRTIKFSSREQERKGRAHQFGTRRGLPPRRWFGVTVAFARRIFQTFGHEIGVRLPRDRRRRIEIELKF